MPLDTEEGVLNKILNNDISLEELTADEKIILMKALEDADVWLDDQLLVAKYSNPDHPLSTKLAEYLSMQDQNSVRSHEFVQKYKTIRDYKESKQWVFEKKLTKLWLHEPLRTTLTFTPTELLKNRKARDTLFDAMNICQITVRYDGVQFLYQSPAKEKFVDNRKFWQVTDILIDYLVSHESNDRSYRTLINEYGFYTSVKNKDTSYTAKNLLISESDFFEGEKDTLSGLTLVDYQKIYQQWADLAMKSLNSGHTWNSLQSHILYTGLLQLRGTTDLTIDWAIETDALKAFTQWFRNKHWQKAVVKNHKMTLDMLRTLSKKLFDADDWWNAWLVCMAWKELDSNRSQTREKLAHRAEWLVLEKKFASENIQGNRSVDYWYYDQSVQELIESLN